MYNFPDFSVVGKLLARSFCANIGLVIGYGLGWSLNDYRLIPILGFLGAITPDIYLKIEAYQNPNQFFSRAVNNNVSRVNAHNEQQVRPL